MGIAAESLSRGALLAESMSDGNPGAGAVVEFPECGTLMARQLAATRV